MARLSILLSLALSLATALANPVAVSHPEITPSPSIDKRATTCTFSGSNGASSASKSKTSCSTIVLSNVAVPSGKTLDLTKLNDNTHVSQGSQHEKLPRSLLTLHYPGHLRGNHDLRIRRVVWASCLRLRHRHHSHRSFWCRPRRRWIPLVGR